MHVRTAPPSSAAEATLAARLGAAALARWLARPRSQPTFAILAEGPAGPTGHALLAHERRGLGVATLEVGALELTADAPAAVEPLLGAAVAAAADAGLPFLALRGAPAAFAPYGLAPCALTTMVQLPATEQEAGGRRQEAGTEPLRAAFEPYATSATERLIAAAERARSLRPAVLADADDLAALADAAYTGLPLAPRRTPPDWRWLLAAPAGWLALEDGRNRLVAYALVERSIVVEAAAADRGAARELAGALATIGVRLLALPLAHGLARAGVLLGGTATVRTRRGDEQGELWGVIDLAAALDALAGELTRRLAHSRYAGWSGSVRLEGSVGAATLRCGERGVVVHAEPGQVDIMVGGVGLAAAAQLILGYRLAADLRATGELRCADVDLGLLDVLFPAL